MAITSPIMSAQGSCSVTVLKSGDNIFISLRSNKGLAQGINEKTGVPVPDWTKAANQPTITPEVQTALGAAVTLTNHQWEYNGVALSFDATTGQCTTTGLANKFKIDWATGALTITDNLASATNIANDTLTYRCTATTGTSTHQLNKSIDVVIQPLGDGGYLGTLTATNTQLSTATGDDTSTLFTQLFAESGEVFEYWVKYYKDDTFWLQNKAGNWPVVTRDDVNGEQLFIAIFYGDSAYTKELCQAAIRITDTSDIYSLKTAITSANTQVSAGKDVTVSSILVNARTGDRVTPGNPVWSTRIIRKRDWSEVRRVATDTITVTAADCTDTNGSLTDVEVYAELDFTLTNTSAPSTGQWSNAAINHPVDNKGNVMSANAN